MCDRSSPIVGKCKIMAAVVQRPGWYAVSVLLLGVIEWGFVGHSISRH